MFRIAELGRKVSKDEFDVVAPTLRLEMIELQQRLRRADFPTVLVFAGVDGAGKNETVNLLNEWFDPRWVATRAYSAPSDEERERPEYWRYWRDLPPRGIVGLFLRAWYSAPVLDAAYGRITTDQLDARLDRIARFETGLADDGALILKFWLHLSRPAQKRVLTRLEESKTERWQVTKTDWRHYKMYDRFIAVAKETISRTNTGQAPWKIVEGEDARYRELTVLTTVRDAALRHLSARDRLHRAAVPTTATAAPLAPAVTAALCAPTPAPAQPSILERLDMTRSVTKEAYGVHLPELTAKLNRLSRKAARRGVSSVLVFEGWDAAGKGGAIRRITAALDARHYQVIPIAAPSDEERAHHYLWRFWRHLSRAGRVTMFDRSWYGRVLVERVEGLAPDEAWRRAYAEINDFERQLIGHGIVLVKYWLHITKDEQLARFERRGASAHKSWKLTDEDWRNRARWDAYEHAVNDMIEKTSPHDAPWTLVEANCKRHARLSVVETFCARLEAAVKG